ncbi:MAG: prepilin-type N-terminal cleavage/methylation domain-containing protein [Chitinispirillaceae bacterium]|nr:prepilin-type N-terminal cleavage/methylation domain-containing protein [Chitinispirillaceae bacterium]
MTTRKRIRNAGFTFVELLVAFGISALVLIFLSRLFSATLASSNLQDQLSEMNQNARYTIKELSDILMEAGSDLQSIYLDTLEKDTVIIPDDDASPCSGFTVKINPRGGIFLVPQTSHIAITGMEVSNARKFSHTNQLQRIPGASSTLPLKFYTLTGIDTVTNFIYFTPADSFVKGDAFCSFIKERYYLSGTDLCLNTTDNIIAENIDSLAIIFYDKGGNTTTRWSDMKSAEILVRARTAHPDPKYDEYDDHYRRVTLTYTFRLRNKTD